MKPIIPKIPEVLKEFSDKEVYFLTKSVFGEIIEPQPCDVLFVFSGTHPGHWEKDIKAYQKGYVKKILVTGGRSLTGTVHPDWKGRTEAEVIIQHLLVEDILEKRLNLKIPLAIPEKTYGLPKKFLILTLLRPLCSFVRVMQLEGNGGP